MWTSSVIKIARRNAREAGVDHLIHFQERDVKDLNHPKKYGFIITNPPYGERLEDKKEICRICTVHLAKASKDLIPGLRI